MVIVPKNNQKVGDLITSTSAICVSTLVPGINISIQKTRLLITKNEIKAGLRHLYLSVIAPTAGLINKAGSGSNVKIEPTITDE